MLARWLYLDDKAIVAVGYENVTIWRDDQAQGTVEEPVRSHVRSGVRCRGPHCGLEAIEQLLENKGEKNTHSYHRQSRDAVVQGVRDIERRTIESNAKTRGTDDQGIRVSARAKARADDRQVLDRWRG